MTLSEIKRLIRKYDDLMTIKTTGKKKAELIAEVEALGYKVDHENKKMVLVDKSRAMKRKPASVIMPEAKKRTALQKQKAEEKKAEREAKKKKQEREIRKKAVEEERKRAKPKPTPKKKTSTYGTQTDTPKPKPTPKKKAATIETQTDAPKPKPTPKKKTASIETQTDMPKMKSGKVNLLSINPAKPKPEIIGEKTPLDTKKVMFYSMSKPSAVSSGDSRSSSYTYMDRDPDSGKRLNIVLYTYYRDVPEYDKNYGDVHLLAFNNSIPSKKGYARLKLCQSLDYLKKKKLIKPSSIFTLEAVSPKSSGQEKLEKMYNEMGFKKTGVDTFMEATVSDFMKWCKSYEKRFN